MSESFVCHHTNLFTPDVLFSVNCLSLDEKRSRLAVLRRSLLKDDAVSTETGMTSVSNSYIEIWHFDLDNYLFLSQVIYEDEDEPCIIEALEWSRDGQLFACGLDARLHHVDLVRGNFSKWYPVVSGPAWCMKFNRKKDLLAIGTEEGYICVFKVTDENTAYEKNLSRDLSRVLSIGWYEPTGSEDQMLITGSIGSIKIWSYESGSCLKVIKFKHKSDVSVWCLEILSDPFTIISGDSLGQTSFWDGDKGTWINSATVHTADVLTLATFKNKKSHTLYSSGVDPIVAKFEIDSSGQGVPCEKLHLHTHDVRSMVTYKHFLISSGYQCAISRSSQSPRVNIHQLPPFRNQVHIDGTHLLFQYHKSLQIWKVGSTLMGQENQRVTDGDKLPLQDVPSKLAEIRTKKMIHRSCLHNDWIVYSYMETMKVMRLDKESIVKIPQASETFTEAINHLEFINDSQLLVVTGCDVVILKLDESGVEQERAMTYKQRIHRVACSPKFISIILDDLSVQIVSTESWTLISNFNINKYPAFLRFDPYSENHLFVGFSSNLITEYNVKSGNFVKHCPNEPNSYLPLEGIAFHPSGFVVYNQDSLYHFNQSSWTKSTRYSHIIKLDFVPNRKELIVLEMTEEAFKKRLPSALRKKKFGT
ncbi:UTP4 small subunit processome component l(3)72Dn [Brevipalpus obovatus]|uniref:UTP4 small subunit processome component l(3)72Dn n=1 Tax=Brevipalpus obovatus TaxID=246614 RepID=UPI003D9DF80B